MRLFMLYILLLSFGDCKENLDQKLFGVIPLFKNVSAASQPIDIIIPPPTIPPNNPPVLPIQTPVPVLPSLTYSNSTYSFTVSSPIQISPSLATNISTCSILPNLPTGLSLSDQCQISGTTNQIVNSLSFQITATNQDRTVSRNITLFINNLVTIMYPKMKLTFYENILISDQIPVLVGNPTNLTISPSLPSGLLFNTTTGTISGTPLLSTPDTSYTISASNPLGSANQSIQIRIGNTTATRVYGQLGSFTTAIPSNGGITANSLNNPEGICADSNEGIYIVDRGNNRVLYYANTSTTATRVHGQLGSFISNVGNNGGVSANSLANPMDCVVDSLDNLYISDSGNHRVLFYPNGSTTATIVYGQAGNFTTNSAGTSSTSFWGNRGLALDKNNNLFVTEGNFGNHRVLFFPNGSTTATRVYGQFGNFTTGAQNNGGISANSVFTPIGVYVTKNDEVYITDWGNNRLLVFLNGSTTATTVYGQFGSFTSGAVNNGGISANSLQTPLYSTVDDALGVYIADSNNERMLYYPVGSTTASVVFGQTNFSSNAPGNTATTLSYPLKPMIDSRGTLCVTEYHNHRVVCY